MPTRIAMITYLDDGPVDPGYGQGAPPAHISGGLPWAPVRPDAGLPWGPGHPSGGFPIAGHPGGGPVYPPGHPSAGFPIAGHPGGGPVYPPGHPSAGLPIAPVYPSGGLPGEGGEPVDPAWGYSPLFGWFIVYCAGGKPSNELPETPSPK